MDMESPEHDHTALLDTVHIKPDNRPDLVLSPPEPVFPHSYAGFWKRAGAFFFDIVIVYFLMAASVLAIAPLISALERRFPASVALPDPSGEFLTAFLFLVIYWLYHALLESSPLQGSLGKRLIGVRVLDLEGRPVSFLRASFRNLGKLISEFTYWIGFFMAGFSPRKQALHDYLAGCVVVTRNKIRYR